MDTGAAQPGIDLTHFRQRCLYLLLLLLVYLMTVINKKFWEEPIAYFPLIRHEQHRKRRLQRIFVAAGTSLPSFYPAIKGVIYFTEALPRNDRRNTYTDRLMGEIYEVSRWCHDIHTKFRKDWFKHWEVNSGRFTDTQTAWRSHKHTFIFFKIRKVA
jgi:hypothetical protein